MSLVSVVIPAFNAAAYLGAALESVARQSYAEVETIVVDDGSTDDTGAIAARHAGVTCVRQKNSGVAAARNRGIALARGRWVAFLDADDVWLPEKLTMQVDALRQMDDHAACATAFTVVDDELRALEVRHAPAREPSLADLLLSGNVVGTPSTVMCDRLLLQQVGGFDPRFSQNADWDLWIRLRTRTRFAFIPEPLVLYRRHERNMSRSVRLLEHDTMAMLQKTFRSADVPVDVRRLERQAFAAQWMVVGASYLGVADHRGFLRSVWHALWSDPATAGRAVVSAVRRRLRRRRARTGPVV